LLPLCRGEAPPECSPCSTTVKHAPRHGLPASRDAAPRRSKKIRPGSQPIEAPHTLSTTRAPAGKASAMVTLTGSRIPKVSRTATTGPPSRWPICAIRGSNAAPPSSEPPCGRACRHQLLRPLLAKVPVDRLLRVLAGVIEERVEGCFRLIGVPGVIVQECRDEIAEGSPALRWRRGAGARIGHPLRLFRARWSGNLVFTHCGLLMGGSVFHDSRRGRGRSSGSCRGSRADRWI